MRPSSSREAHPKKKEEEVASTTKLQLEFEINEVCERNITWCNLV